MSNKQLSIIIVNFHSAAFTLACIESIYRETSEISFEVIVVDNASYDGCEGALAERFPSVMFVQSPHNVGFARANNIGSMHATGEILLFLNPDTEVEGRGIERMCSAFTGLPRAGVLGCRLENTDGSLQASCVQPFPTLWNQLLDAEVFQNLFPKAKLWLSAVSFEGGGDAFSVEAVSGACMMISAGLFMAVGKFSSDYFMYTEDLDLCYKVRAAGYTNYYFPCVTIVHHGGKSTKSARSSFANVMMRESIFRFLRKTRGAAYAFGYRSAIGMMALVRLVVLVLAVPVFAFSGRLHLWSVTAAKWRSILRWVLGFESWVMDYGKLTHVDS